MAFRQGRHPFLSTLIHEVAMKPSLYPIGPSPYPRGSQSAALFVALALAGLSLALQGCQRAEDPRFLGSAQIDADHYTLAPSVAGPLVDVLKNEGDSVQAGEMVALIDTIPLHWQREELIASHIELQAALRAKGQEAAAIGTEAGGVERDLKRIGSLVQSGSAPAQQEDKLRTSLKSARERQSAVVSGLEGLKSKQAALNAKLSLLDDQLRRCVLRAPVTGRIITRYRNVGEMASPAQPVFEMSRGDTLKADFYVPQPALADLKLGGKVFIRLDGPDNQAEFLPATIGYISDEAEFAPKNTQTRESRNELVFEIRSLAVDPTGKLKRGLPVEIWKEATP
jgi:HlyD family secretion protein